MDETLKEAKRLHALGFAIHWLRPKSKIPLESGWTTGPRKEWHELEKTYQRGFNIGVRLGEPSRIRKGYLAVVDVDIKSPEPRHKKEALHAVGKVLPTRGPLVFSGRGNGSRHYYCRSVRPFKTYTPARSAEEVKVHMPSKPVSKKDRAGLTESEIAKGFRISPAWEVSLYSDGRQVVLPPSVHPDSGERYRWKRPYGEVPLPRFEPAQVDSGALSAKEKAPSDVAPAELKDFTVTPVDLEWLDISPEIYNAIQHGAGVQDRSAFLLRASTALFSAGLDQNEVLTVLTDRKTYLGEVGYDHAQTNSRQRAAAWVHRYTVRKVSAERSPDMFQGPVREAPTLTETEQAKFAATVEQGRSWKQDLLCGKNGQILHQLRNVVTIIDNVVGPEVCRRDEFAFRDTYSMDTPWGGKKGALIEDDDIPRIKFWLSNEFGFEPATTIIIDALVVIATRNAYDPVKDFLNALPKWDRVPRLDTWLKKYFNAKGNDAYLAQIFRKWMVAFVMRGYRPGAKFDWMPIFEGTQKLGKSSFGRILVGDRFFLDQLPPLSDKEAALALLGIWTTEFGELSQFRKNELETIKSFVTRTVDKVRPPYGRRTVEHARRCVFFGTTNRETYLTDETGNRRFKPIMVGRLDFAQLKKDRLQLFAEAKHLWKTKKENIRTLDHLTDEAAEYEARIQEQKMVPDDSNVMMEVMLDFIQKIKRKEVNFDLSKFRIIDLFGSGAGCLGGWRSDNRNYQSCAKMLKKLKCRKSRIRGQRYWGVPGFDKTPTPHQKGAFTDDKGF